MGACASKVKQNKEKYFKKDVSTTNKAKKNSTGEQSSSVNVDQYNNVPFIDSEEKLTITPPRLSPTNEDEDEQTTLKNDFETNQLYSNAEVISKLKQEVSMFLQDKVLWDAEERQKLVDYVQKRIIGNAAEKKLINEHLEECFNNIQANQPIDNNNIKQRLMNIITIYVASQSPDNSFLKALYDKMGSALDLNSLNAEIREHEVVNVTVTKRVRQCFVDDSSSPISNQNLNMKNTVIHLSANESSIPDDVPEDIRRKAEQVLNSFNDVIHSKSH